MTIRKNGVISLLAVLAIAGGALLTTPAQAGSSIAIPLPPLPPIPRIKLPAPPLMVWLPTPAVYVAMDSPYPIFCHENRYYLRSNNAWYVGPGYEGPWASVQIHSLPPGLRHYHEREWNHYQHEAHYWHEHGRERGDHGRPHFYGWRGNEHRDARGPHSDREDRRSRHDDQDWRDHNRPGLRQIPEHDIRRPVVQGERPTRTYSREPAQKYSQGRGRDVVRTQYRGENREHGNKHWRMSY